MSEEKELTPELLEQLDRFIAAVDSGAQVVASASVAKNLKNVFPNIQVSESITDDTVYAINSDAIFDSTMCGTPIIENNNKLPSIDSNES